MAESFANAGSATIAESGGHPLDPGLRPIWRSARVSGPRLPGAVCPEIIWPSMWPSSRRHPGPYWP